LEAKTNYTIVGIIVLSLAIGLVSSALWLSMGFNQKSYSLYTVYLHEAAAGLSEESPVKFNGVQVGFVKRIQLNRMDPRQVEILLSIQEGTPITTSTFATLISQGITGVTYVGLSAASSNLTPLRKMAGEPYPVIPTKPSLFNQLDAVLKEVSESVYKLSTQAQRIFNEENAQYVRGFLRHLDEVSTTIANNKTQIDRTLKNADRSFVNVAKFSDDLPKISKELQRLFGTFNHAGKDISSTMHSGKNALDKLSQQAIPPAVLLLRRLNNIASDLSKVSDALRQNPSVVLRGTTPPPPGPGE
jgi:phospholipid/cholesterol/gamma-HCH transport system substrate-binding protein